MTSSLSAAALADWNAERFLAKRDSNVCVVEKNAQFGGCTGLPTSVGYGYSLCRKPGWGSKWWTSISAISVSWTSWKIKRLDDAAFDTIYYKKEKHTIMQWDTRSLLKPSAVPSRMRKKCYAEQLQAVGNLISVDHLKQRHSLWRVWNTFVPLPPIWYGYHSGHLTKCTGRFSFTLRRFERCLHFLPACHD